jgi:hypothetical protein
MPLSVLVEEETHLQVETERLKGGSMGRPGPIAARSTWEIRP